AQAAAAVLEQPAAGGGGGAGRRLAAGHARRRPERLRDPGLHRWSGRRGAVARHTRRETTMAGVTTGTARKSGAATAHEEPFFLVGSERSGTTLVRLMLAHHPRIECAPEFEFLVEAMPDGAGWPALEPFYEWL